MLKKIFIATMVLSMLLVQITVFATTSIITRNDDFESFPTGNLDGTNNPTLTGGTTSFKATAPSADFKGGWALTVGTGTKFDLVSTLGKNGVQTKALKLSRDTVNSTTGIFAIGGANNVVIANNGKVVWESTLRNGGDGNSDIGAILISKVRYYPALGRMDFTADTGATPSVAARNNVVSVSTTEWFKFRLELDYPTETLSIYINDIFKASQKYGTRFPANTLTNSNFRFFVESTTASASLPGALFIDDAKIYSPSTDKTLAISSSTPVANDTAVAVNQSITIKFNKIINGNTLSTITVKDQATSTAKTISSISYDPNNAISSITIFLQNQLEYPKTYVVDLSGVLDIEGNGIITDNQQLAFTTHTEGKIIQRYEDFEDYNTGNIFMDTKVINPTPPTKTENGVVYAINATTPTPKLTGALNFSSSKTGSEVNLVQTTDNNNNPIKALQSINKDTIQYYSTQITLNGAYDLTNAKRFVYKARVRGGNGSDETSYYTNFGNARVYFENAIRTLGGADTDGIKNYYGVVPAKGTWFDIKYELDLVNKIALVYVDDNLIATQVFPATMLSPTTSTIKLQEYTSGLLCATYIDKIEVYTLKEASGTYITIPTFLKDGVMIDKLTATNLGTLTGQAYYINKGATKNITVVYGLYYDGNLVDVSLEEKEVPTDVRTAFNCSFTPQTTELAKYQVKAIFLDSKETIKPIYKSYSITPTGCSWK